MSRKKIAIYTLGCKVNQYESDAMADSLLAAGYEVVAFNEISDVYIINTCSVTNMAERKSRQIIHRAKKLNPEARIVAAGCYVQAAKEAIEKDMAVDLVVGNNRKKDIVRLIDELFSDEEIKDNFIDINKTDEYEAMTVIKPAEHTRAYVKVQDGCNNFCAYCIIPYTRGRIRSRSMSEVECEIRGLALRGIREVVLTGINLSSYADGENGLTELIVMVSNISGIDRIRLGSLEPRIITDEFLSTVSRIDKFCPHFHLSLQSACNDTLKRMNRKYTIEEYKDKCELIRSYYDRPAITTDVIVGFPGETDEEFEITRANLEALKLYEMHIFKYSKRSGTVAASMPDQVSDKLKEDRSNVLLEMTARHKKAYEDSFIGETQEILAEEYVAIDEDKDRYMLKGHTKRYVLLSKEADRAYCEANVNQLIDIIVE